MTKHAVVGLSASLRLEAETYGVRVSVLCPSAVETPLIDSRNPEDLPRVWRPDLRRYLANLAGPPYPSQAFAEYALAAVEPNRGVIVAPASARIGALVNRILPSSIERRTRRALRAELRNRPSN